ncbi:unnamed protein product, partial [Sphacelaria rigidula]
MCVPDNAIGLFELLLIAVLLHMYPPWQGMFRSCVTMHALIRPCAPLYASLPFVPFCENISNDNTTTTSSAETKRRTGTTWQRCRRLPKRRSPQNSNSSASPSWTKTTNRPGQAPRTLFP